jgi:hypothetical protein
METKKEFSKEMFDPTKLSTSELANYRKQHDKDKKEVLDPVLKKTSTWLVDHGAVSIGTSPGKDGVLICICAKNPSLILNAVDFPDSLKAFSNRMLIKQSDVDVDANPL